jgi:glutathione S-transferase
MIKLYGFPVSNYFNMVKLALLEKGLAFEEVAARPSQEGAYKAKSPMGKVPCIEVAEGFISETGVILDYLEEQQPGHLPQSAFARAKARELMRVMELYIELPGRRHFGHVFFGGPKSDAAVEEVRPTVEKGLIALQQLMGKGEWLCGDQFSLVDIYAYYTLGYAAIALKAVYGWDIVAEVPGLGAVLERIKARATTQQVDAAQQAAFAALSAK